MILRCTSPSLRQPRSKELISVVRDRTGGRRTSLRHSGLSRRSFSRSISTHWVMASAKDAPKPCYQGDDLPSCSGRTCCWIPTAEICCSRAKQVHTSVHASSAVSHSAFLASSTLDHDNQSQNHVSSPFLTVMVLHLALLLTDSPAWVE